MIASCRATNKVGFGKRIFGFVVEQSEPFAWMCTECKLIGYGYSEDQSAVVAGVMHARDHHGEPLSLERV